jgi:uncharacterized cupin superfamily protein
MAKRIDVTAIPPEVGSRYPPPFHVPCRARVRKRLGDAASLTQFGVNLIRLPPGSWSSQRHWHAGPDEFVFVLGGELVLVTGSGEELLKAGDCAGFRGGDPDGHHLQNRSASDALYLEVGSRLIAGACHYTDVDMYGPPNDDPAPLTRRDGTPYLDLRRRGPDDP